MQLYLLLNTDCNLKCNFCIRGNQSKNNYTNIEELRSVLSKNDFSKYHLLLTGGEPTLHPFLSEIIRICSPRFNGISINTNGKNSSWIDECKSNNFHVQLSVDGTSQIHNKIRGNNSIDIYSCIMATINKLNAHNISYNISTTVGQNNYDCIIELCQLINDFPKIKYWKVSPMLPFGCADSKNMLSIDKWNSLVDNLLEKANVRLQIQKLFDFRLLDKYMGTHPDIKQFPKRNCGNVRYKLYVYPDFSVYPCTCLTDYPLGNLRTQKLTEIMDNPISQDFIDYKVKPDSVCYKCKYLPICNGGCIGMSYHFFNAIGKGDYRCPLIQKQLHTIV